jgi:hypothetical protein
MRQPERAEPIVMGNMKNFDRRTAIQMGIKAPGMGSHRRIPIARYSRGDVLTPWPRKIRRGGRLASCRCARRAPKAFGCSPYKAGLNDSVLDVVA